MLVSSNDYGIGPWFLPHLHFLRCCFLFRTWSLPHLHFLRRCFLFSPAPLHHLTNDAASLLMPNITCFPNDLL